MQKAFAKILAGGNVVGNGFFLRDGYLVTCAHVLRKAKGIENDEFPNISDGELIAEFPWESNIPDLPLSFEPDGYEYNGKDKDVAILSFCSAPPDVSGLLLAGEVKLEFDAWAQPYNSASGNSPKIIGVINGTDGNGCLSFWPLHENRQFIEHGCSGAPVFVVNGEMVEGIICRVDDKFRQAYVMPAQAINTVFLRLQKSILLRETTSIFVEKSEKASPETTIVEVDKNPVLDRGAYPARATPVQEVSNASARLYLTLQRLSRN